jgi:hypothetical protein
MKELWTGLTWPQAVVVAGVLICVTRIILAWWEY